MLLRKQGLLHDAPGRKAVASGSMPRMAAADMRFHEFIHGLSGNPLVAPALASQLSTMQRVMGEVLLKDETPRDIWDQHEAILAAIAAGDAARAETLARRHIDQAARFMVARLRRDQAAA
ncbi:MAG: FCD domain-containing protein [Burkholderiaceae bacterium]